MAKNVRGPSMHDVAARAGVSHQTVSRVLNGFTGIRPATRERVEAAIAELGYRRNLAARSLATGRSLAIGVMAPDAPNFGPTSSVYAVERAARDAGFHPLVTITSEDAESVKESLDFLFSQDVEALVLMAPTMGVLEVIDSASSSLPTVFLLTGNERGRLSVAVDQFKGARLALEHLYELGHRHIQHVRGPADSIEAQLRVDAYHSFARETGITAYEPLLGDWRAESGYELAARLDPAVTAVFCGNDQMAFGVTHALGERGLRVPDDVSVVGYDDVPEARHSWPPLTTVHQDFRKVGDVAVAVVVAALRGEEQPDTGLLEPTLIVRESTAPPAASPR